MAFPFPFPQFVQFLWFSPDTPHGIEGRSWRRVGRWEKKCPVCETEVEIYDTCQACGWQNSGAQEGISWEVGELWEKNSASSGDLGLLAHSLT